MGLIIVPLLFLVAGLWITCLVLTIIRISNGHMYSWWSVLIGLGIASLWMFLIIFSWRNIDEIWGLRQWFEIPMKMVAPLALAGALTVYSNKNRRVSNLIGFGVAFAAIITVIVILAFPAIVDIHTYYKVEVHY